MVRGSERSSWSRRTVLKSIPAGATVSALSGVAAARGGPCPDCPEGTRLLAKYEFDDDTEEFVFDTGACEDPFTEVKYTNKAGEEGEPIEVSFTSPVLGYDVAVKRGPECTLASQDEEVTFEVDDEKDEDGFEHTISVPADSKAISHFNVCAAICFQVDFVVGEVIENLSPDDLYGDRLISVKWDNTINDRGTAVNNGESGFETDDGDVVTTDGIQINASETEGSVNFDIELGSDDVTLTLVSYVATCPPNFDIDTVDLQELVDYETTTFTSSTTDTLTVDLPSLEWLDELCHD